MTLSRRSLLAGASLAAVAVALEACGVGPAPAPASGQPSSGTPGSERSPAATSGATATAGPSAFSPPAPSPSPDLATLRRRIGGLLVVGFRGLEVHSDDPIARAIVEDGLGGVVLFDRDQLTGRRRNIASPAQLADLTAALQALAGGRRLIVAVDQEGGRVARLTPAAGFPATTSAAEIGRADDAAAALEIGRRTARTLRDAGITWNLAPVVDLDTNPRNPSIGALGRSFSADPDVVVAMAGAIIRGHRESGVLTTLKHFPGIGSATGDTDRAFVDVTRTWRPDDLGPFRRLMAAGLADAVMVGNVLNGRLDAAHPASLSEATIGGSLRGDLAWDGPVITDDLQAGAIRDAYPDEVMVRLALAAGSDILLFANQQVFVQDVARRVVDIAVGLVERGLLEEARIDASLARIAAAGAGAGDGSGT